MTKTVVHALRLTPEQRDAIRAEAERRNRTMSDLIRLIVFGKEKPVKDRSL